MKFVYGMLGLTLAFSCYGAAYAQTASDAKTEAKDRAAENADGSTDLRPYRIFYLKNANNQSDANELLTAIRLLLPPRMKVYLAPTQNAIMVRATQEDVELVQRIIEDLDRPKKVYQITYTIAELDGGHRIGLQHYSLTAASGQRATLKQGSKVPIVTGSYNPGTKDAQQQMTYLDVGLNFDATPEDIANGVSLKSKVEQSTVAPEVSGVGASDPIIRQSVLENVTSIPLGKSTTIGSVDVPGSTRHLDIQVEVDLLK